MSTQKNRPKHFRKAFKFFLIIAPRWLSTKSHGFLNPWFPFFTMFSSNEIIFITSFIFRRWIIKINYRLCFYIIIRFFIIFWWCIIRIIISIIVIIITRCMLITRLCLSIRNRNIIRILRRFLYNRFTRSMQSSIIFLFLFLLR